MKLAILMGLTLTVLGFSSQSLAKLNNCQDRVSLNIQGQQLEILVGPLSLSQPVQAKLEGEKVPAFVRSENQITIEIPSAQIPKLKKAQRTSYDARVDHHTIHEYVVSFADGDVKSVEYRRYQDIDYGYGNAANLMGFTRSILTECPL